MAIEYKLQVECSDLQLEILFNGFPVLSQNGGMRNKNAIINQWLVYGRNQIEVRINAHKNINPSAVSAYLSLNLSQEENSIYNFSWKPSNDEMPLPYTSRTDFYLNNNFGEWTWQKAELLELNENIIIEITRFLQKVYESLNSANLAESMGLFRIKAEEQAIAYGIPLNERINQQRNFFEQLFSENGWGMKKIDFDQLEYKFCVGNRAVLIRYKDGSDVLESKPFGSGEAISFPLYISKLDGQWIIVR